MSRGSLPSRRGPAEFAAEADLVTGTSPQAGMTAGLPVAAEAAAADTADGGVFAPSVRQPELDGA